jgi:hypothetical protein
MTGCGVRGKDRTTCGRGWVWPFTMAGNPRSPCHAQRELTSVPGEKYKRCPVCEQLWTKGRDGRWDVPVHNFAPVRSR